LNNYEKLEGEEKLMGIIECLFNNALTGQKYCEVKDELSDLANEPDTKQAR
jgi:hypothetical protein